ncbi:MAG: class I SAM-dependent methyltransferase [Bacteroidia bacterium]|nr:class I SAM-dependent methyltransferase [Bacteroidia bacterium]MCZ2140765.1 class I SAM-dependent methyltransferase [Bacteroidia bacterium]
MEYDPIKKDLGVVFNQSIVLRKLFYKLLDLLLLRSWHIHRELRNWKQFSSPFTMLDAGSGFGQYSFYIANRNKQCTIDAVDVKEEQIEDCNNFFRKCNLTNVKFSVGDLTKSHATNKYDLVLCVDVMEHILEDVDVFTHFHQSMKSGGMLLISTPSDQGGSNADEHGESFIGEHVRDGYPVEEMREKLKKAGFNKSEILYSYGSPGKIAWKLSMKYPMSMLNASKLFFVLLPFYYLVTYPFAYVLNWLDTNQTHKTGTGLIVKAWKD